MLLAALLACSGGDTVVDTSAPPCAADELLDGEACVPAACGTGRWGDLSADVWVDCAAADSGDGTQDAPFATLDEALGEAVRVGVAAGTCVTSVVLDHDQDDLVVQGRCAALTTLTADGLDDLPTVVADGRMSSNWTFTGLTVAGGFPGVLLYDGGLHFEDVVLAENRLAAVLAGDSGARLTLTDVLVRDVREESLGSSGTVGYGLDLESGAELEATRLEVVSAYGIGLLALDHGTQVSLTDVVVRDTRPNGNGSAYGLQLSQGAEVTGSGVTLTGNGGAGALVSSGAIVDLGGLVVEGTRTTAQDTVGLMVHTTGELTLTDFWFEANDGAAIAVLDEDSSAVLSDGVVRGGGVASKGLQVQWGGVASLSAVTFEDLGDRGIEVAGGALDGEQITIRRATEVGLLAGLEDTRVTLDGVLIEDIQALADGTRGAGLELQDGATLAGEGVRIDGARSLGVLVSSGATATLAGLEVVDTHPEPSGVFGRGIAVQDGGHLDLDGALLEGNREAGLFVSSDATATLRHVQVYGTGRSGVYAAGAGLNVQDGGSVEAEELTVGGTEGPGLHLHHGAVQCTDCTLEDNGFAGAVNRSGELVLVGGTVSSNPADAGLGGGVGVFAVADDGAPELVLSGTALSDHAYGSVWLDGPGSYLLDGAELEGGPGWELVEGRPLHGDAVFATGGIAPWDSVTGLLVVGSTLHDSAGAGVFLDGASASLVDNTWSGNGVDLHQQGCGDEVAVVDGLDDAGSSELCPESQTLVVSLEMQMLLEDAEASSF